MSFRWTAFRVARTAWRAIAPPRLRRLAHMGRPVPWEPELRRALRRVTKPGATCADVGANVGQLTEVLLDCAGPSGRVVAFEPHPETAAKLAERFAGRHLEVVSAAVSDGSAQRVALHPGREHRSAEWTIVAGGAEPELEVDAVSLDEFFARDERVDVVKIDVEGAEGLVLAGMRRLLQSARPTVLLEFHNDAGWAARSELLGAGYVLLHPDGARLDPDGPRVFHVLALPRERS